MSAETKTVAVALKAVYTEGGQNAFGLLTKLSPQRMFVHTMSPPRVGSKIRLRFSLPEKAGTIEVLGVSAKPERDNVEGFQLKAHAFPRGEQELRQYLGLPEPRKESEKGQPKIELQRSARVIADLAARLGIDEPKHAAKLLDISETGAYLTSPKGWDMGQELVLELMVPVGEKIASFRARGSIARVDPPGSAKYGESGYGVALRLLEGSKIPGPLVRWIRPTLAEAYGEQKARSEQVWVPEEAAAAGIRILEPTVPGAALGGMPFALKVTLAVLFIVAWAGLMWFVTAWRLEGVLGPPPDPSTLPIPP